MTLALSQTRLLALLTTAFALGVAASCLYDFFRFLRLHRHPRTRSGRFAAGLLMSVEDLLFFAFAGLVFSVLFFVENDGKVRPSAFLMALWGFLTGRRLLSRFLLFCLEGVWRKIHGAAAWVYAHGIRPPLSALQRRYRKCRLAHRQKKQRKRTARVVKRLIADAREGFAHGARGL